MRDSSSRSRARRLLRRRFQRARAHVTEARKFQPTLACRREMARRWLRLLRRDLSAGRA